MFHGNSLYICCLLHNPFQWARGLANSTWRSFPISFSTVLSATAGSAQGADAYAVISFNINSQMNNTSICIGSRSATDNYRNTDRFSYISIGI